MNAGQTVSERGANKQTRTKYILLALITLLTRLPWIGVDYGSDPDNYRVANAARTIAATGQYVASRLPGYPVQEYGVALLGRGGPLASNGLTALLSVAAVLFLTSILRRLHVEGAFWGSFAFALTPVIYISSISSLDYIWAIAFVLGATHLVVSDRPLLGGLFLGLAIGCRLTSGAMLLPLFGLLLAAGSPARRWRDALAFSGVALAVGCLCFIPVVARYGLAFFAFKEPQKYPDLMSVVLRATTGVWGTVGVVAWALLALAMPLSPPRLAVGIDRLRRKYALLLCLCVLLVYFAAYARLPLEAGYLVPVVPFSIIGAGLVTPPRLFRTLCLLLCISSVCDIGRSGISLGGQLLADHAGRRRESQYAHAVVQLSSSLAGKVVVLCGSMQPRVLAMARAQRQDESRYLYLIENEREIERYRADGYLVLFLPEAEAETLARYGFGLQELNARELKPIR